MNIATIWIIVGIVLILSELMATSIVAVFFGIAAIIVGLLLNVGLIESYSVQYLLFGVLSLVLLFTARGRCKRWFVGYTADSTEQPSRLADDIGRRVIVHSDFHQGAGRVVLNGVQWDAESADALKAGDVAFVVANHGIKLVVSAAKSD
ncbi:MAG: peptidase [Gammaproteobacteria bacterium HGW-Gammaproteobacteria-15]|nr:MAG: peptidase [Gammaproteobacteria bacterium HGW-Gammaproteobacteria-15]